MKIACIGEAMIELSLMAQSVGPASQSEVSSDDSAAQRLGASVGFAGDTLNTAIYLSRIAKSLRCSIDVAFVSAIGKDAFSEKMLEMIRSEAINIEHIGRHESRLPGLYAITTDKNGERSFSYWRSNSAARMLFQTSSKPQLAELMQYDAIYYSAITLAILPNHIKNNFLSFLADFRKQTGKWVAFDSNYRPALWSSNEEAMLFTEQAYRCCDIALPSLDDELLLFNDTSEKEVLARLKSFGINQGALKRGADGPLDLGNHRKIENAKPVEQVIDSTAAGDSFNGGYLANWIVKGNAYIALEQGHRCASHVVKHKGAIIPANIWNSIEF